MLAFRFFRPTQKMGREGPKWGGDAFLRHKKTSPTIWAERILILRTFDFWIVWGPKFASIFFMGEKHFQEFAPNFFMGGPDVGPPLGPHMGPPTKWVGPTWAHPLNWAQAWAQAPPPAAPAPADEFSDPNLTPLPTHPGMKYVARTHAAIKTATCPKC